MSSIGDTIDLLSTSLPLFANTTWTSSAVVLGQWNSLVVMIRTNADAVLEVQWSGNGGLHWDAIDYHQIVDSVSKRVIITTQQKTIRLVLQNGITNQGYLRLFTYGVTTNNSSLVSLVSAIDIGNIESGLYGQGINVKQSIPLTEYNFATGSAGSQQIISSVNPTIYSDIFGNAINVNVRWGFGNIGSFENRYLFLRPGPIAGAYGIIQGRGHRLRAGETLTGIFVASISVSDAQLSSLIFGLLPNTGNAAYSTTPPIYFGGAFGWMDNTPEEHNFSVIYGNTIKVARTSWNLDKCDGNSILPDIAFKNGDKPNMFKIELSCGGNLRFSIMHPTLNKFIPVHQVKNLDTQIFNPIPAMNFTMYSNEGVGHSTGVDEVRVISFTMSTDTPAPFPTSSMTNLSWTVSVNGGSVFPVALRNLFSLGGFATDSPICLDSVAISTSGSNPVTVEFILDAAVVNIGWTNPVSGLFYKLPIQTNITSSNISVPSPANVTQQFELGANDSLFQKFDTLLPFLYGFRPVAIRVTSKSTSNVRICLGLSG